MSAYRNADGSVYDLGGMPEYDVEMLAYHDVQPTVEPMLSHTPNYNHAPDWPSAEAGYRPHLEWTYVEGKVDGKDCRLPLQLVNLWTWLALCGDEVGRTCGGNEL